MTVLQFQRRWFRLTPDRFVIGLLLVECLLWLSERFQWFYFNQWSGETVLTALECLGAAMLVMFVWFVLAVIFRWRFQFSIRSLLVLAVVVAIPSSWLSWDMKRSREEKVVAAALEKLGGKVIMAEDRFGGHSLATISNVSFERTQITDAGLERLKGLTRLHNLSLNNTQITDAGLEHLDGLTRLVWLEACCTEIRGPGLDYLKGLPQLTDLSLSGTKITDAGLQHIRGLTRLRVLYLDETKITDAGLVHLAGSTQLRNLCLDFTEVAGPGLEHLRGLPWLHKLYLSGTRITDASLGNLCRLTQLRELDLTSTAVTDEGVKKLKQALPKCEIYR